MKQLKTYISESSRGISDFINTNQINGDCIQDIKSQGKSWYLFYWC